jgi:Ni/Fe-hydrogenase subunit HybB-like protein
MAKGLSRLKPGVNKRTHLFLSAILWTGIGLLLIAKGGFRLSQLKDWDQQVLIMLLALLAGSFKAYFILDKSVRKVINRILNFKDGTCLGAVYSVKTWILVLCMMGMGVILRNSALPINLICLLYLTIGWALLLSSRLVWKVWLTGK